MEYKKLVHFLSNIEKLTSVPFIIILRNSMVNIVPIIIVGSFFLLFFVFFKQKNANVLILDFFRKMYILTMGFVSLYLSVCIGYNYASYYSRDRVVFALVSVCSFLVSVLIYYDFGILKANEVFSSLGVKNMFSCIIISFLSCYIFSKLNFNFLKDKSIPDYVSNSLNSIFPFFITVFFISLISYYLKITEFLRLLILPFEKYGDSIIVVWVTNLFLHLTNFLGIHGISLINSVFLSLWQKYLGLNSEMVLNFKEPIYITAYPFFQWFIWIGGAGSTLGLNILLIFSKTSYLRVIGRSSVIFSIFNINEPLLFGLPIVFNPYFFVPFILCPLVLGSISFVAFYFGFVNKPYIEAPWMFPSPLGAYLSTTDYRAILLNLLNVIISMLIYYPFLRAYEKKLNLEKCQNEEIK